MAQHHTDSIKAMEACIAAAKKLVTQTKKQIADLDTFLNKSKEHVKKWRTQTETKK